MEVSSFGAKANLLSKIITDLSEQAEDAASLTQKPARRSLKHGDPEKIGRKAEK